MNRIFRRASALVLLILVLIGGMGFFIYEYVTKADSWVVSVGSPHVYNNTNIGCGTVMDRSGKTLLDLTEERVYAEDKTTRMSTLHWLGDRNGFINARAVSSYAGKMGRHSQKRKIRHT